MSEQDRVFLFKPGMQVHMAGMAGATGIVALVDADRHMPLLIVWLDAESEWIGDSEVELDLDHAGTAGLLLEQYQERSGHHRASFVWSDAAGGWAVDPNGPGDYVGTGPSKGAAVMDALVRLGPVHKPQAPSEPTLNDVLDRLIGIEARLRRLEGRGDP